MANMQFNKEIEGKKIKEAQFRVKSPYMRYPERKETLKRVK
jgi:hypothetical protein